MVRMAWSAGTNEQQLTNATVPKLITLLDRANLMAEENSELGDALLLCDAGPSPELDAAQRQLGYVHPKAADWVQHRVMLQGPQRERPPPS